MLGNRTAQQQTPPGGVLASGKLFFLADGLTPQVFFDFASLGGHGALGRIQQMLGVGNRLAPLGRLLPAGAACRRSQQHGGH